MSNSLAIATVTAALREVLQPVVGQAVSGAQVFFTRPDGGAGTPPAPAVNVYLYQVTPNLAFRNEDLPTRRADGSVAIRPQAALDLHYLFTFHGNDANLEPQLLLGAVISTLHAQPLLSPPAITKATQDFTALQGSDLASQVERVKFTPTSLTLEEFSKLWSVFFQIEYSLSAAYQASVVLIESGDQPIPSLPVQVTNLYSIPFRQPQVSSVNPSTGAGQPIVAGSTLLIEGQQLSGAITLVLIENQELTPSSISDALITLPLPSSVHAGAKGLQVVQETSVGTPPTPHHTVESDVAPFVLQPTITASSAVAAAGVTTVTLAVAPNIGVGQRAVLLLNNLTVTPPLQFTSAPVVSGSDTNQVQIPISGVPTGAYLCRVQIDGAESPLTLNASNQFTGPTVAMP